MKLLLAGLFAFGGVLVTVALLSSVIDHVSPVLIGLGLAALFLVLCVVALVMFNSAPRDLRDMRSEKEIIEDLAQQGLLVDADFNAVRALQVEEFEDEGPHCFIELEGGSILYLNGQYLYDYEAIEDEEHVCSKSFPCTQFTIRRHRDEGYVVDILCRGSLLEPGNIEPAFQREYYRRGKMPEDGDVITNESFDELKARVGQAR